MTSSLKTIAGLAILAASAITANSQAAILATYDLTGAAGTQASNNATSKDAGVAATAITRGSGLTGNAGNNSLNSAGFGASFDANDYVQVGIAPVAGGTLNLDNLFFNTQRSNTGPATIEVRSSLDNYGSAITTLTPPSAATAQAVALPGTFDALTSGVTFRLYGYGASSASGTFRLTQLASAANPNAFSFDGSVTPGVTPEPATLGMIGALGVIARRGRK